MKKALRIILITSMMVFLSLSLSVSVKAQSSQETLYQYISDLQKNPSDNSLREKIIKHVQEMKPAPAVPEEVQKYMDRGIAAIESAKTAEDFQDAAAEFMKAVTAAPWLGNGYRNLAIAQDKAGQYDAALKNLQLYLLTRPSSSDEAWAKTLMNKVEYRKEKAAKESSPQAAAAREQNKFEDLLKKIDGRRYTCSVGQGQTQIIVVRGKVFVLGNIAGNGTYLDLGRVEILGRETTVHSSNIFYGNVENTYIISEDGDTITLRSRSTGGKYKGGEYGLIYLWQR